MKCKYGGMRTFMATAKESVLVVSISGLCDGK